jgi:cell division septation protein DedD
MKKTSVAVLFVTLMVIFLLFLSSCTKSTSTNPCGSCHPGKIYSQYLDILEVDSATQIPSAIEIGETQAVSVVVENSGDPGSYSTLSDGSVTLASKSGHFSVSSPTYNIGDLPLGKKTATWQITGVSEGFDSLLITASGINKQHRTLTFLFSDAYSPSITVEHPSPTPSPTASSPPTPPPSSTANPTSPTPAPSQTPTTTPTPDPKATPSPLATSPLSIVLMSPTSGEKWAAGTVYTIKWYTSGGTEPLTVTLDYSVSNINGSWTTIAGHIADNGSLTWETPNATATIYLRAFVNDSGNPTQSALMIRNVEVNETWTPSLIMIIIPVALLFAVVPALILLKWRKQKQALAKSELNGK